MGITIRCLLTAIIIMFVLFNKSCLAKEVVVNKIKIFGAHYTSERIIRNFIREFHEGDTLDEQKLERYMQRIKVRLLRTTWFYNVETFLVPSRKCGNCRNVIIELNEGYLYRFWGGKLFAGFGIENLAGEGKYFGIELGWNRQIVSYNDRFINFSNFFNFLEVGNKDIKYVSPRNNSFEIERGQKIGLYSFYGYHLPEDMDMGIFINAGGLYTQEYQFLCNFAFIGIKEEIDKRNNIFSATKGYFFSTSASYDIVNSIGKIEADFRRYHPLIKNLSLAFRSHLGLQQSPADIQYFYYSLCGIDGVRSSDGDSMINRNVIDLHGELRWNIRNFAILGMFTAKQEGVLFFDMGRVIFNHFKTLGIESAGYAFGLGYRLYLDKPVYLPLRLEIGLNKKGEISCFFSSMEPF